MKITDATGSWKSVTLSADEIWETHEGAIYADTDATEAQRLGLRLSEGKSAAFPSGATVYYKLMHGTKAVVARVAV